MAKQLSQPNFQVPIVDENGILNRNWAIWIRDLYVFVKSGAADEEILGLVKQMPLSSSVTEADAAVAPASYNQAHMNTVVDLLNEVKADLNTLITNSKAAGQMSDA